MFKACDSTHAALPISLPLWFPVNCVFWPVRMLDWLAPVNRIDLQKIEHNILQLSQSTASSLGCALDLTY